MILFGPYEIDPENELVWRQGQFYPMQRHEARMLLAFARAPGRPLSFQHLKDAMQSNSADLTICRVVAHKLRRRVPEIEIRSCHYHGYLAVVRPGFSTPKETY